MELKEHFTGKIFQLISETADELGLECYVVGGYQLKNLTCKMLFQFHFLLY